jgi:hypothetical protein
LEGLARLRYSAPESNQDAGRAENGSLAGSFTGQEKPCNEGGAISLPYGSQGLFQEHPLPVIER